MTDEELIKTIEEATSTEQENSTYMIFQYDIDSYYIGTVDYNLINQNEYAFNIAYPMSIFLDSGNYIFDNLYGLGDIAYSLSLNKSKVIAIFTPNDKVVAEYERIIHRLFNNIPELEIESAPMNFYEVKTIQ